MSSSLPRYIVVLGAARSGTKFVRDLIASSPACHAIPYDVNHVWRAAHPHQLDDLLHYESRNSRVARRIEPTLRKLSGWHRHPRPFIVEKTVSNCLRVPYVDRILDEPLYVHILRDGRDVIQSVMREWNKPISWNHVLNKLRFFSWSHSGYLLWAAKNAFLGRWSGRLGPAVWGVRYPGIEQDLARMELAEVCAWQWVHCLRSLRTARLAIPQERWLTIRYEDLVHNPATINQLANFLKLSDHRPIEQFFRDHVQIRPQSNRSVEPDHANWASACRILDQEWHHWADWQQPCHQRAG